MGAVVYETAWLRAVRHGTFGLAVHDRTPDRRMVASLHGLPRDSTISESAVYFACAPANARIPGEGTEAKLAHVLGLLRMLEPAEPVQEYAFGAAPEGGRLIEPAPGVVARRAGRKVHLSGPRASAVVPAGAHFVPRHRLGPGVLVSAETYESLRSSS